MSEKLEKIFEGIQEKKKSMVADFLKGKVTEISDNVLIDLVCSIQTKQPILESSKKEVLLCGYITESGELTETGKKFIDAPETIVRLKKIVLE